MMISRLAQVVARRAPNVATAGYFYWLLRRQALEYRRAGGDPRAARELFEPSADGGFLTVRGHVLHDARISIGAVAASQKPDELGAFLDRAAALQPRRVCEIGTSAGGTLYFLTRACAADAVVVSVDVEIPLALAAARAKLGRDGQRIVSIAADSHQPATVMQVREALRDEPLDVLFIDGDHSYDGVKRDFELYLPLVRPGGLVGLHDIQPDARTRLGTPTSSISGDVPRFWEDIKPSYRTEELISDAEQDGYGIGVVYV